MKKLNELIEKLNLQKLKEKKFLTFKVMDKNFENEIVSDLYLPMTVLSNVKLNKIEFKNLDLELSSFYNCSFKNCSFNNCYFGNFTCGNCQFKNCQFIKSTIKDADFHKVVFTNCNFLKNSFVETWFRSCKFINTSIEKSDEDDLMVTIIVDSTFGKSDKSITFNGEFFLADILLPANKIDDLLS
jgi:uncharacterized protein YjbI with pentapeptide repeats